MEVRFTAVALTSLLAACSAGQDAPDRLRQGEVLVQISADGRAEARPDTARLTLGVESSGPNARAASEANAAVMNRVIAAVRGAGVAEADVQTRGVSLSRIGYGPERGRFQAGNVVEVRVRDPRRAGEVLAQATEAGANVVAGPTLDFANPQAVEDQAYAAAYRAARARAEAYAGAAGMRVDRVLAIRDGEAMLAPRPVGPQPEEAAPVPVSAPPVSPGTSTRYARVRVDFALAPN